MLAEAFPDARIEDLQRVDQEQGIDQERIAPGERHHSRAVYCVTLRHPDGRREERSVCAEGVGLGYFGERERLAPSRHPAASQLPDAVADYVSSRSAVLPVARDPTTHWRHQDAPWRAAGRILSGAFGRGRDPARLLVERAVSRRLLAVSKPAVIDEHMSIDHWFARDDGTLAKVRFADADFGVHGGRCYDPVYDLASLGAEDEELARAARAAYERITGQRVDEERWLLYSLVALQLRDRDAGGRDSEAGRALARAMQRWFATRYFAAVPLPTAGALCAIDIDSVLETSQLGFTATSPSGALALRALTLHGFRPVLSSGRSAIEVRERCESYRLAGVVSEYGAVIYDHVSGETRELLDDRQRAHLTALREALGSVEGIVLDPAYTAAVRAFRYDERGRRRGLLGDTVASALDRAGVCAVVRTIPGVMQTDFMVVDIDKDAGLCALGAELPAALGVGDTVSDLPMLARSTLAWAPSNANEEVRSAPVQISRRRFQGGLADAVGALLGHAAGSCASCAGPSLPPEARLLARLLSVHERGKAGKLAAAARLAGGL